MATSKQIINTMVLNFKDCEDKLRKSDGPDVQVIAAKWVKMKEFVNPL